MKTVWRRALYVVVAVVLYGAAGAWLSSVVPAGAQSEQAGIEANARKAIEAFFTAVIQDDKDSLAKLLAPEFQILRSNGVHYTAKGYLDSDLPIIAEMPPLSNLVVTASGDSVVATYSVTINETIDGQVVQTFAPRMSVFRKDGDQWLIVAHGNFAVIDQ